MGIAQVVDLLACPHCAGPLHADQDLRAVVCANRHRFDLARQGYLNLLAAAQPSNADTVAMVAARERFLAAGTYDPIADAARDLLGPEPARILDAGAGTGRLLSRLLDPSPGSIGIALDVSTAAARRAARAHPRLGAVVADVWRRLPVRDAAVDAVISNFAPRNPVEFARVLAPAGRLLTITPTENHLAELRRTYGLLDVQPAKAGRLAAALSERFVPLAAHRLDRRDRWSAPVVADAIAMGPNAFHPTPERPEPADAEVTVSVELRLWSRRDR